MTERLRQAGWTALFLILGGIGLCCVAVLCVIVAPFVLLAMLGDALRDPDASAVTAALLIIVFALSVSAVIR